jgi:nucleotide-binding universal stress UspA family protein
MFRHILIPTDGSDIARAAVRQGIDLAKWLGASVTLVTVSRRFHIVQVEDPTLLVDAEKDFLRATARIAESFLRPGEEYADMKGVPGTSLHVYDDQPWRAIVDAAHEGGCDLIFMASHGHRGLAAVIPGSTAYKVVTHARIPAVVSHSTEAIDVQAPDASHGRVAAFERRGA